jgi:ligand-binding sensor protein
MQDTLLNENIRLTDIIQLDVLQRIQDSFFEMTHVAVGITDETGQAITKPRVRHEFCCKYTRGSSVACMSCQECDERSTKIVSETKNLYLATCHSGLVYFVAPILANGRLIGLFRGGQVLTKPLHEADVRKKAELYEIDPDAYAAEAARIPVMKKDEIEKKSKLRV